MEENEEEGRTIKERGKKKQGKRLEDRGAEGRRDDRAQGYKTREE